MQLNEFVERFGSLSEEDFLARFQHPFLLEEGRLSLTAGAPTRQLFLLRDPKPLRIGRDRSADLVLRHHQVSSRHAILFPPPSGDGPNWQVMDANSTNGTFIDGRRVPAGERTSLQPGVLLRFGLETRLAFLDSQGLLALLRKRETRHYSRERLLEEDPLGNSTKHDLKAISAQDLGNQPDPPPGLVNQELVLTCEPYDPIRLIEDQPLVIGRTPKSADVVLPHAHVSRRHAIIERKADGVYVRDLGSSNGCSICGVRVGSAPMLLLPGKPLEIGPFQLKVEGQGLLEADPGKTQAVTVHQTSTLMGKLELTPLVDLLQAIESEEQTGSLLIQGQGGLSGTITFRQGEPYDATTSGGQQGAEAIYALLDLERGSFVLDRDETKIGERRLSLGFGEILLDDFLRET